MEVCVCRGKVLSLGDKKSKNHCQRQGYCLRSDVRMPARLSMSPSGPAVFNDMNGNLLFSLQHKHLTVFRSYHAVDAHGHDVFTVKGKLSLGTTNSTCHFKNASDGREVELEMHGDWLDKSASIKFGGEPVAHASRSHFQELKQRFSDKHGYFVEVAPGVDLALIAALCVCLDEEYNEK